MTAIAAVGTFFKWIGNAVAAWLSQFAAVGVPVAAVSVFLICFTLFERIFLARLVNFNPALSARREVKNEKAKGAAAPVSEIAPPRSRRLASGQKVLAEKNERVYNATFEVKK